MTKIEVFDPAMCCSTGVCGPAIDEALPRFAADVEWLKGKGASVQRFNLSQEPRAFLDNKLVRQALAERGQKCLPLVLVDGQISFAGIYPTREQLAALAGIESPSAPGGTSHRSLNIRNDTSPSSEAQPCCTPRPGGQSGCC